MEICIKSKGTIDKNYKLLRKKEYYEPIVLKIMNDSKLVFPSKYKKIEKQDHKEPDFVDIKNGNKFDAKLLFENQICIALSNNDLPSFINKLTDMVGMNIPTVRNIGPEQTMLYQEMERRINSLEDDESGILFLPYPILMSLPGSFLIFVLIHLIGVFLK